LYFDDLCAANIVYRFDIVIGRFRFVLGDVFGHKTLIPIARLLPAVDRRRQRRQGRRLYNDTGYLRQLLDKGTALPAPIRRRPVFYTAARNIPYYL